MDRETFLTFANEAHLTSSRPCGHVALYLALIEKGVDCSIARHKVILTDEDNNEDQTPGLALGVGNTVINLDGCVGWDEIKENEISHCQFLFKEVTGKESTASFFFDTFPYDKLSQAQNNPAVLKSLDKIRPLLTESVVADFKKGFSLSSPTSKMKCA